jgi:hypothetical protein
MAMRKKRTAQPPMPRVRDIEKLHAFQKAHPELKADIDLWVTGGGSLVDSDVVKLLESEIPEWNPNKRR